MTSTDNAGHGSPRVWTSLLAFWAEAGVDACVGAEPVDRMRDAARPPPPALRAAPAGRPAPSAAAPASHAIAPGLASAVADARDAAAAACDLDALKAAIAAFQGCALSTQGARGAVFARGAPDAPVMVIGEGPGAEEDLQGAPFVGRAGKLLDRMLAAAGLTERVFITNTVFWRPPGNRTPSPQEQAACAPFVERAIQLVGPRLLLLAGGVATKSLLGREEGILSLRGRWFDWRSTDGALAIPALPTLHPAFLLRQPGAKRHAWRDLLTLAARLDEA